MPCMQNVFTSMPLNGLLLTPEGVLFSLREDREDFWLFLGRNVGWGRFTNADRFENAKEVFRTDDFIFILAEILPPDAEQPHPQLCPWRALEPPLKGAELFEQGYFVPAGQESSAVSRRKSIPPSSHPE